MSTTTRSSSNSGVGLGSLLFLVFLVLKLTHVIDWSWWWVTAPLWGSVILVLFIFGVVFTVAAAQVSRR